MLLLLGAVANLRAQTVSEAAANERVKQLSQAVKALGAYEVRFDVAVGDYSASGSYTVSGVRYALTLGNIEAYGDAENRYEVDKSRKEVVIDKVDGASHNVLNNPTSAFDFIADEYLAETLSQSRDVVVLRLTPRRKDEQNGVIEITLNAVNNLPKKILYYPSGESIEVAISHIAKTEEAPAVFNPDKFKDFEIIDFR